MLTIYTIDIKDSQLKHVTAHSHLRQVLAMSNIPERLTQSMKRTSGGKLKAGEYYINISYADDYAFVMVTKRKFGIDAEKIKCKNHNMKLLLSKMLSMKLSSDLDFYKAWTAMESEVKYYGNKGLFDALMGNMEKNPDLQTIHIIYEGNMIAITSTNKNIEAQEVLFKKCKDETV